MATERTPRRLGRGLDVLLGSTAREGRTTEAAAPLQELAVNLIRPNPFQPRRDFADAELEELRESMRSSGLLQPITVRRDPAARGYQLIAGERRWRAAQSLGWPRIPAMVRDVDDQTLLALALVENLQRSDLNPLDEADGYRRLISEFRLSQQDVAQMVGKSRSTVANMLRILELPATVQAMIRAGELTIGQVRPLLTVGDEKSLLELAAEVRAKRLPARVVEERVARRKKPDRKRRRRSASEAKKDPSVRAIEDRLRRRLQTDVKVIARRGGGGDITVRFYSADDLDRLLERLGVRE